VTGPQRLAVDVAASEASPVREMAGTVATLRAA
jgi:hypothetical protein